MNNANKYNSRINTFIAPDVYRLAMPVLPPADLSLAGAAFASSYCYYKRVGSLLMGGFSKLDQPFLRGFGFFSNLADGLVAATDHYVDAQGMHFILQLERFAAVLSGSIDNVAGTNAVTGVGTLFTEELAVGSTLVWVDDGGVVRQATVLTITDDTNIVLSAVTGSGAGTMFAANTTAANGYLKISDAGDGLDLPILTLNQLYDYSNFVGDVSRVKTPRGLINVTAASAAVTGRDTFFTEDLEPGDSFSWLGDNGTRYVGCVQAINSDISLDLVAVAVAGSTATLKAFFDLDDHLRILARPTSDYDFYTVTIDPAFNTPRLLMFHVAAVIEHSLELTDGIR